MAVSQHPPPSPDVPALRSCRNSLSSPPHFGPSSPTHLTLLDLQADPLHHLAPTHKTCQSPPSITSSLLVLHPRLRAHSLPRATLSSIRNHDVLIPQHGIAKTYPLRSLADHPQPSAERPTYPSKQTCHHWPYTPPAHPVACLPGCCISMFPLATTRSTLPPINPAPAATPLAVFPSA